MKTFKKAVALVINDKEGNFLIVKRADDPKDQLAGLWGFPAVTLRENETHEAGAKRVGLQKLGVNIELGEELGESTHDRGSYTLQLTDFKASIINGVPQVPQSDKTVSQYSECKFTTDPTPLIETARSGSQCTQIFLESIGVEWQI